MLRTPSLVADLAWVPPTPPVIWAMGSLKVQRAPHPTCGPIDASRIPDLLHSHNHIHSKQCQRASMPRYAFHASDGAAMMY